MFMRQTIRHRIYKGNELDTPALLHGSYALPHTHEMKKPTVFAERLAALMAKREMSQYTLAGKSGVPQPTIQRILSGETQNPKIETLRNLAKVLGARESLEEYQTIPGTTDTGYGLDASQIGTPIITWDKPEDLPEGEFVIVPRFDIHVACGNGHVVYDEMPMEQGAAFRSDWVKREGLYLRNLATVRATGDSMEPSIYPGDALLVDRAQTQVQDGRVFLLRFGDEVRVKRLFKRADGGLRIVSDNSGKYPEEIVTAAEMEHIEIIGRVVHKSGAM